MANEYRETLFCLIFDHEGSASVSRPLDSLKYPGEQVWTIGRIAPQNDEARATHIRLRSPFVSRYHAQLRYNEETCFWEIKHVSPDTKTYLDKKKLPLDEWKQIYENSLAVFSTNDNQIIFSYKSDDTLNSALVDPEPTASASRLPKNDDDIPEPVVTPNAPWQLQLGSMVLDGANKLPIYRFMLLLVFALVGLAIILILGAAAS